MQEDRHQLILRILCEKANESLPSGSRLTLYGSRARGDARTDSDWDLHIIVPGPEKLSLEIVSHYASIFEEVGLEMNEIINARVYSPSGWEKRSFLPFYKNIMAEGVVLFQN